MEIRRRVLLLGGSLWMAMYRGSHAFAAHGRFAVRQADSRSRLPSCRRRCIGARVPDVVYSRAAETRTRLRASSNGGKNAVGGYIDDAFGLIFLTASVALQDYTFATAFGVLSVIANISVRFELVPFDPRLPGLVACASLLVSFLVPGHDVSLNRDLVIELAETTVSVVWGLVQHSREPDGTSGDA